MNDAASIRRGGMRCKQRWGSGPRAAARLVTPQGGGANRAALGRTLRAALTSNRLRRLQRRAIGRSQPKPVDSGSSGRHPRPLPYRASRRSFRSARLHSLIRQATPRAPLCCKIFGDGRAGGVLGRMRGQGRPQNVAGVRRNAASDGRANGVLGRDVTASPHRNSYSWRSPGATYSWLHLSSSRHHAVGDA